MLKEKAVATLGMSSLLLPAWLKLALQANDRIKLYLSLLQAGLQHADAPHQPVTDWSRELAQLGLSEAQWLQDLAKSAYLDHELLVLPALDSLVQALSTDLTLLARPICDTEHDKAQAMRTRRDDWLQRLDALRDEEGLSQSLLIALTSGDRTHQGDSFHLLVMDLHKLLNALSGQLATENLDGAHVWQIADSDRPLIRAFMRGLQRTAPLKFGHPGLDTAVTRSGSKLLIQNDIGTNDVHVLVIEVEDLCVSLTYSDLHPSRFDFFQQMLEQFGFQWTLSEPLKADGLNAGKPYRLGHARRLADNAQDLEQALTAVASRIVFVIDWNRARKRLQNFVRKPLALELLREAARQEWGHMAWLLAGGERLAWDAMQAVDSEAFRVGDRLDQVLGEAATYDYLRELLRLSSVMLRQKQPAALVADEARMLLARVLRQRTFEFDLIAEHAACSHALGMMLCELLERCGSDSPDEVAAVLHHAKRLERQADHLLMEARQRAERQSRWQPVVDLLEKSDDVADALEESIFIVGLLSETPDRTLASVVMTQLQQLADTTLLGIQDQIKAVEIARHLSERSDPGDNEMFLQALWRTLHAERVCDELSRSARQEIVRNLGAKPAALMLASDLARTVEKASDGLLAAGHALRQMILNQTASV